TWSAPVDAALGTYRVGMGAYSPDWVTEYKWTDTAATFAVAAVTPSPTPPPAPTATPVPSATTSPTPTPTTTPAATPTSVPTAKLTVAPTPSPAPTVAPTATPVPAPSFTTGVSAPASVLRSGTESMTVSFRSATATNALVDVAVFTLTGSTAVYQ